MLPNLVTQGRNLILSNRFCMAYVAFNCGSCLNRLLGTEVSRKKHKVNSLSEGF